MDLTAILLRGVVELPFGASSHPFLAQDMTKGNTLMHKLGFMAVHAAVVHLGCAVFIVCFFYPTFHAVFLAVVTAACFFQGFKFYRKSFELARQDQRKAQ